MSDDSRLFTSLYEKHYRAILAYCLRRTNESDARDAAAEVFAVAWRRLDDVPKMAIRPWLYGVARRVLSRHFRSIRRRRRLVRKLTARSERDPIDTEGELVMRWEYRAVHNALDRLSKAQREVLFLSAWEELGNEEIGIALGCSTAAAAQRLHRAKRALGESYRAIAADRSHQDRWQGEV
jgi:RNA polymerase sigma factor (sigma-70 family)